MRRVTINLENCYGIRKLQGDFDFSTTRAFGIYAPNGVMKSSLAKTFLDIAENRDSQDRIFPSRNTVRQITDENNDAITGSRVLVVLPYDQDFSVNEQTSTLLLDPTLKREYDDLLRETADAKSTLLDAIKSQSRSKLNMESEISSAIMPTDNEFDTAMLRLKREIDDQQDTTFSDVHYDKIFSERILTALDTNDLKNAIQEYALRYNELLEASTYFKKGTFDYYNAAQIAKSLADNGFFNANHTVKLNADSGHREIETRAQLEEIISQEKETILSDETLRKQFELVARQLTRNVQLREFYEYIRDNEAILARLGNPRSLRQDVIKAYLKVHENLYNDWVSKYDAAQRRRRELEEEASKQRTRWENVIDIFNERFFVPFRLEAKNKTEVLLGQTSIIDLGFTYVDGEDTTELNRSELLQSLSTGERKALYVLNVIFEIETRKATKQETLIVVDDLADSFDYRNKYAIIQYLKDISDDDLFKLIVMTHNFDFFRTLESRFVNYSKCLMASKNDQGVTLTRATGIKNIFANDWKPNFFKNTRKKIASIPFLRNIVEMTTGEDDPRYIDLTSMLHWKASSGSITIGQLDGVYNSICQENGKSENPEQLVYDILLKEAEACLSADAGMNLENKIVLAISIRLLAERYMIDRIKDQNFVESLIANQARGLTEESGLRFPKEHGAIATLDRVGLMTPENIHVNSFMYEPIVDLSDDHLRKLFREVRQLV